MIFFVSSRVVVSKNGLLDVDDWTLSRFFFS